MNSFKSESLVSVESSLKKAVRVGEFAANLGFDWPDALDALVKVPEEADELQAAIKQDIGVLEELGDLLFAVANVARKLNIDPDVALDGAAQKFERRFNQVMAHVKDRGGPESMTLQELEDVWIRVKAQEKHELDI